MRSLIFCLVILGPALAVSPMQKVIQMLTNMEAEGKKEKQEEEVAFATFQQFCSDTMANKKLEIEREIVEQENLEAAIGSLTAEANDFAARVASLEADLQQHDADLKAAIELREKEGNDFVASERDLGESVDALYRAIRTLKARSNDVQQESLLQLSSNSALPEKARRIIESFIALKKGDFLGRSAPEADAYEFQSGGIVQVLENLLDKFKAEKHDAEVAEINARHSHEMLVQDLKDSIEQANEASSNASRNKGDRESQRALNQKELNSLNKDLDEDKKYLRDLGMECQQKSYSFKEKQHLRRDELEAISQAVEILSSGVSGRENLIRPSSSSFLQISIDKEQDVQQLASEILSKAGNRLHSPLLTLLSLKMISDPFEKVRKMIANMITKLMNEDNKEITQKAFCDKEMGVNKLQRDKLSRQYDELVAKIEQDTALSQQLGAEIAQLSEGIQLLTSAIANATKLRMEEKKRNEFTISEAKEAQIALARAQQVLKDFFSKASIATAFVQIKQHGPKVGSAEWDSLANPDFQGSAGYGQGSEDNVDKGHTAGMQTFGDAYKGQTDQATGVLGLLEVIASDFANVEADTMAAENQASDQHRRFVAESNKNKATKNKDLEMKTRDKVQAQSRISSNDRDRNNVDDQLRAANRYYDNLKPQCVNAGVSLENRQQKRREEIESLQEALTILEGS